MITRNRVHLFCLTVTLSAAMALMGCSPEGTTGSSDTGDASGDADVQATDSDHDDGASSSDSGASDASDVSTSDVAGDSGADDSGTAEDTTEPDDVTEDAGGSLCDQTTPLEGYSGWSRATDIQWPFGEDEEQTFANIFGTWPGTNSSGNLGVLKGEYFALRFETGDLDASSKGQLVREALAGTNDSLYIAPGQLLSSFSRCPGDFDPGSPALPSPGCVKAHPATFYSILWGGPGSGRNCELQSNTEYYLNVVYSDSEVGELPPQQATCGEDEPRCGNLWAANGSE